MNSNPVEVNLENYLLMQNKFLESNFRAIQEADYLQELQLGNPIIIMGNLGFSHIIIQLSSYVEGEPCPLKILGLGENAHGNGVIGFSIDAEVTRIQKGNNEQIGNKFFSFFNDLKAEYREQKNPENNRFIRQPTLDSEILSSINLEQNSSLMYYGKRNFIIDVEHNLTETENYQSSIQIPIYNCLKTLFPNPSNYVFSSSNLSNLVFRINEKVNIYGSKKVFSENDFNTDSIQNLNGTLMRAYSSILKL